MKNIWINVAENDSNGNRTGFATVIQFGELGSAWANDLRGVRFSHIKRREHLRFRIFRREYYYPSHRLYAGNLIYNAYQLSVSEACSLFNAVNDSAKFHWEDFSCEADKILKSDGIILPGDFYRIYNGR